MASRSRGYYRDMREKAINRKDRISKSYRLDNPPAFLPEDNLNDLSYGYYEGYWHVKHKGMLSKGKIHCSCGMCAFHGTPIQDKRNLEKMDFMLSEELENEFEDSLETYCSNIPALKNKIKRKKRGIYYPHSGMEGTKISVDKKVNIEKFKDEMIRRKLKESLSYRNISGTYVVFSKDSDGKSLKHNDLFIRFFNGFQELLHCDYVDEDEVFVKGKTNPFHVYNCAKVIKTFNTFDEMISEFDFFK